MDGSQHELERDSRHTPRGWPDHCEGVTFASELIIKLGANSASNWKESLVEEEEELEEWDQERSRMYRSSSDLEDIPEHDANLIAQ